MINWDIVPFKGVGKFKLYSSVEDVKKILNDEKFFSTAKNERKFLFPKENYIIKNLYL